MYDEYNDDGKFTIEFREGFMNLIKEKDHRGKDMLRVIVTGGARIEKEDIPNIVDNLAHITSTMN